MSTQTSCTSCNSCQGCNNCQKCNAGCQVTCDVKQAFCAIGSQTYAGNVGRFSWSHCVAKDESIAPGYFDKAAWDKIISYINSARQQGKKQNTGGTISLSSKDDVDPFSAAEFKRVAAKVNYSNSAVTSGAVIYGKYFSELATAANNAKISSTACNQCNTDCNGGCDECQSCDAGCDGCNANATTITYCCGCYSCQSCHTSCQGDTTSSTT